MRRGRTILDSPEAAPRTSQPARGDPAPTAVMIRDPLSHYLENLVTMADSLVKLCTEAGEGLAEAHLADEASALEETLGTIVGQKDQLESLRALYRQSTEAIASTSSSEEQIKTIKASLKAVLEAPLNGTKRPELSAFRKKIFEAAHPDEAVPADLDDAMDIDGDDNVDMVVAETKPSTVCQLTQRAFENPVKNPDCGHVYSQAAIVNMIRGAAAPCPIAGCRKTVRTALLVPDTEMMLRLERSQNRIF